jgi:hypothetical protein
MYYKWICILYALLCGQNFILIKGGCYTLSGPRYARLQTHWRHTFLLRWPVTPLMVQGSSIGDPFCFCLRMNHQDILKWVIHTI